MSEFIVVRLILKSKEDESFEILVFNKNGNIMLEEFIQKENVKFIQIVTTPFYGYFGMFKNLNHHSKKLNKELWNIHNKNF